MGGAVEGGGNGSVLEPNTWPQSHSPSSRARGVGTRGTLCRADSSRETRPCRSCPINNSANSEARSSGADLAPAPPTPASAARPLSFSDLLSGGRPQEHDGSIRHQHPRHLTPRVVHTSAVVPINNDALQ